MAVEMSGGSSDMFLSLKAVVGTLAVLIKNYDVKYIQHSSYRPLTVSCSKPLPIRNRSGASRKEYSRLLGY